jgi:hypothetical protein
MSKLWLSIGLCLFLGLLCSPILNAQTLSRKEAQINCGVDLEKLPMTSYGFATATLKSLGSARDAVNDAEAGFDAARSVDNRSAAVTGMMRGLKLATNDFICAKQAVKPFTSQAALSSLTPIQRENITTAATVLTLVYDQKIAFNDRVLELLKRLGSGRLNITELSHQLSTMQIESDQVWRDLVAPVAVSLTMLVDMRATDESGNFIKNSDRNVGYTKRLVITKAQKQALLDRLNQHFPELKDGTPQDKTADPAKTATLYLKAFDGRLCSDEPASTPAGYTGVGNQK